mgnify:CR=1 FL=1
MRTRAWSALLSIAFVMNLGAAAAEAYPGDGGKADSLKGWYARDYETALASDKPLCVYFFDPNQKINTRAKLIEGAQCLANFELKDVLTHFTCLKIRSDGTDVKGWPAAMRESASRSASLYFISSDFKNVLKYDRSAQSIEIRPDAVMASAHSILQYEKKKAEFAEERAKLAARREGKDKDKEPVMSKGVPGLKNSDDKEPPKKPAERKRMPVEE